MCSLYSYWRIFNTLSYRKLLQKNIANDFNKTQAVLFIYDSIKLITKYLQNIYDNLIVYFQLEIVYKYRKT